MRIHVFSSKAYDRRALDDANRGHGHDLQYLEPRLTRQTVSLARECDAVCVFVNDELDAGVLIMLHKQGVRHIALRCAGFNNVDINAAEELGMTVCRVPAYSPHAVAEHTVGLMLCLLRRLHRAYNRVREGNFSLEGLLGGELSGSVVGVVGAGQIGQVVARLMLAFGARVLAFDVNVDEKLESEGVEFVDLTNLLEQCDIVTLHCPLLPATHHMISHDTIARMKRGAILINTSRGGLIHTPALIDGLKSEKLGAVGIDVYEEEDELFFQDRSDQVIRDDDFARLMTFPNVLITGHQAFFTARAMHAIAQTTLDNLSKLEQGEACDNIVRTEG